VVYSHGIHAVRGGAKDAYMAFVKILHENPALKPSGELKIPAYGPFLAHARHLKRLRPSPHSQTAADEVNDHDTDDDDDGDDDGDDATDDDNRESASTSSSDESINLLLSAAETVNATNAPPPPAVKSEVKTITLDVSHQPSTTTTVPVPVHLSMALMPTTTTINNSFRGGASLGTHQPTRPDAETMTKAVTLAAAAAAASLGAPKSTLREYTLWTPQLVRPVPTAYHPC